MENEVEIGLGKTRQETMYRITRDGFVFLAMGFTGTKAAQFKEAYINAFNQMEKQLNEQKQLPATTDNLALAETDKYQLLNNIVKSMQIQSDPVVVPSKELIDLIQAVRTFLTKKATANSTTTNTRLGKRQHHPRQRLRSTQLRRLLSDRQLKPA